MASTNKTTNLELSQFIGSDSPKWLTDYNADMEKIDAGYQTVKAQADATDLVVSGHTSSISTLQDTTTSQGTAISGLRTDVTANSGSINTINSLIGNGEPTTTDKTIIGAINELAAEITPGGGVAASSVSYDNTTSGLTATNVQAAIDEVKADIPDNAADVTYSNTSSGLTASTVQAAIDEIASSTSANDNTFSRNNDVSLSSYTSTMYTTTSDGFLELQGDGSANTTAFIHSANATSQSDQTTRMTIRALANGYNTVFIHKGTKLSCNAPSGSGSVNFVPLS